MHHLVAVSISLALVGGSAMAAATPPAAVVGDGLKVSSDSDEQWSSWQARLAMSTPTLPLLSSWSTTSPSNNTMLAGDRYLGWGKLGDGGGLRATGALLLGAGAMAPSSAASSPAAHGDFDSPGALPYLGLGYSAWWARTGVGVSADVGVAAQRPGQAVRFGRVVSGTESLDEMLRAMQIAPMLQVNLSYAF